MVTHDHKLLKAEVDAAAANTTRTVVGAVAATSEVAGAATVVASPTDLLFR